MAFGDSNVAGCELINDSALTYRPLIEIDEITKPQAFPAELGRLLDVPVKNFSMSAGSNARSLRLLWQHLPNHKNALVLFGYTSNDRSEFFDANHGVGKSLYTNQDQQGYVQIGYAVMNYGLKNLHPLTRDYFKYCSTASLDQQMFYVEAACAAMDAVCVHLPLFDQAFDFRPRYLFDFENRGNYLDWCRHRRFSEMPGHHYGQDAHQNLARLLNEYVRVIYADK